MIKRCSVLLIICLAFAGTAAAAERASYQNDPSKAENTGVLGGIITGALVGGPPGAVAGAVIGGLLGHGYHATEQVADLRTDLYSSQIELARLKEETEKLELEYRLANAELDRLRAQPQVIPATLQSTAIDPCCDNTVLSLHFRTGSSDIESVYEEQLASMVNLAKAMATSTFEITGYADRNGDADANLELSRKRSEAVRKFLNGKGIDRTSITTIGYGETKPFSPTQSFETDFFDRRVIVRLRDSSSSMLAENPNN